MDEVTAKNLVQGTVARREKRTRGEMAESVDSIEKACGDALVLLRGQAPLDLDAVSRLLSQAQTALTRARSLYTRISEARKLERELRAALSNAEGLESA